MDLFSDSDARREQRRRLTELGCFECGGLAMGVPMWRLPDGSILAEDEAVAWLKRQEGSSDG